MLKNYRETITFRQSEEICRKTKEFTEKFLPPKEFRRATHMNDSARSMKQNLAEGSTRNGVSDLLQFIGFGRASGEELREDIQDVARELGIVIWDKSDPRLQHLNSSLSSLSSNSEEALNQLLDLVIRTNYLMDQQRRALEKKFIEQGGYTENLAKKRRQFRGY